MRASSAANTSRARAPRTAWAGRSRTGWCQNGVDVMRLEGKTALVTGAGSGIGKCIAETYAREGARVTVADINHDAAKSAARTIGNNAIAVHCDVTQKAEIAAAVEETLSAFGALDILVNNAGTSHVSKPLLEIDDE